MMSHRKLDQTPTFSTGRSRSFGLKLLITLLNQSQLDRNLRISIFSYPVLFFIILYRYTLSPFIGNQCRYYPTCSHYAEDAIKKHGAFKGLLMGMKRVFRCHPWHEGGYDPVPQIRANFRIAENVLSGKPMGLTSMKIKKLFQELLLLTMLFCFREMTRIKETFLII